MQTVNNELLYLVDYLQMRGLVFASEAARSLGDFVAVVFLDFKPGAGGGDPVPCLIFRRITGFD